MIRRRQNTRKLPGLWTFVQTQAQDNEGNAVPEGKGDGEGGVQDGSGRMSPGRGGMPDG